MADIKISEMTTAATLNGTEVSVLSQSQSGQLVSVKATLQAIANWFAVNAEYTNALNTTDKRICGAINELKQLISLIPQFSIEVVQVLPTEDISDTTIYLVPAEDPEVGNYYEEYIHVNNTWELVGSTAVDLSGYYTKVESDGKFAVTISNTISPTTTTKKVADIKQNNVTTPVYADDADAILRQAFGEHTVTGNPVSVDAFLGLEVASECKVTMNPIQDLSHGEPSPTNICPISGRDRVTVTRTAGEDVETHTHTYASTVYGGVDDFVSGEGSSTMAMVDLGDITFGRHTTGNFFATLSDAPSTTAEALCSIYKYVGIVSSIADLTTDQAFALQPANNRIIVRDTTYTSADAFNASTSGVQLCYELATPTPITNTPEDISLLKGVNVVSTDGDSLELKYSADIKAYIDSKLA